MPSALPPFCFVEARLVLWGWANPVTYERSVAFLYDSTPGISGMERTVGLTSTSDKRER